MIAVARSAHKALVMVPIMSAITITMALGLPTKYSDFILGMGVATLITVTAQWVQLALAVRRCTHAPPTGVTIDLPHGDTLTLTPRFRRIDSAGLAEWAVNAPPGTHPTDMTVGVLPAHTTLTIDSSHPRNGSE